MYNTHQYTELVNNLHSEFFSNEHIKKTLIIFQNRDFILGNIKTVVPDEKNNSGIT